MLLDHISDDIILETRHLYKEFYGNIALDDVSLKIKRGEIHAICGENGAGKSTFIKAISGVYIPESGDVIVNGQKAVLKSARDMTQYGMSIIFQEFNLMPDLSVDENIHAPNFIKKGKSPFVDRKEQRRATRELLKSLDLDIDPKKLISELSVSEKQMVEIAKALSVNAEIIMMDEPTAALNSNEVDVLYDVLLKLKASGKTIIYVSHRMKEIFALADRVTVFRDGKYIGTKNIKDITHDSLARMMVGRDVKMHDQSARNSLDEVVMKTEGLTKKAQFKDISFELRKGEILGISGLMGCGRESLAKALYGLEQYDSGEIHYMGERVRIISPKHAMSKGIMYLTDDRKDSGVFEKMGVGDNISMNVLGRLKSAGGLVISKKKVNEVVGKYISLLKVKCTDARQEARYLSGGNQQKLLIARALTRDCRVLILLEPTRGVDIATKMEIYALLSRLADEGISILYISSDLPEMITMCDRMIIMWQGQITGEFQRHEMTEQAIILCATGKIQEAKEVFS